ncbi:hypothetical protein COO60DRAFT_1532130 [Scenedesmus sp. NREL 46B-D3]|nr:hypothetical protein COO60DRAFT_1532130 [Scenedesmus sp. NREL 46B-D3]
MQRMSAEDACTHAHWRGHISTHAPTAGAGSSSSSCCPMKAVGTTDMCNIHNAAAAAARCCGSACYTGCSLCLFRAVAWYICISRGMILRPILQRVCTDSSVDGFIGMILQGPTASRQFQGAACYLLLSKHTCIGTGSRLYSLYSLCMHGEARCGVQSASGACQTMAVRHNTLPAHYTSARRMEQ